MQAIKYSASLNKDWSNIIEGCIKGKRRYQQLLYEQLADTMYRVCLQYAKDEHEAKDLLQEGFVKVFNNLNQFRFSGSFEGWVRRIFVNTALESFRAKKIRFTAFGDIENYELMYPDNIIDKLSAENVLQIIQSLSPQYRIVFNLYAIEGYNHREIGEMLGISEGTSKSNLSRAKLILQKRVNELMPHYGNVVNE